MQLIAQGDCDNCPNGDFHDPPQTHKIVKPTFSIFPNPAIDYVTIEDKTDAIRDVVVYNLVGRKIKSFDKNVNDRYLISELPKGLYLVQLVGHQGEILTTQRFNKR